MIMMVIIIIIIIIIIMIITDCNNKQTPYKMKFWRHLNLANLAIFLKIA